MYSTESGRMCPQCRQPVTRCSCKAAARAASAVPAGGSAASVRVELQTKGRGGKAVTVIRDVTLNPEDLMALGKRLRSECGAGGTLKDGVLEIQGDHREKVTRLLMAEGWKVKRVGGP